MKDHPQIRAFCLVDKEWTKEEYYAKGIEITSMCAAYDAKGKILQIKIEDKYNTKKAFEVITIEPIDDDYYKYIGNINKIVVYYDKQY